MKKNKTNEKKLSLNKLKLVRVINPSKINGGDGTTKAINQNTCLDPENGSKPVETILGTMA